MKPTFMTPQQFRDAQACLGLSDKQLAAVLGYSATSYVRGHKVMDTSKPSYRRVTKHLQLLLQAYLDGYRPNNWPS